MAKIRSNFQRKLSPPRFHVRRWIRLGKSFTPDQQLEKKCRWLVQYMDQPVMITDDQENLLYANPKACELIGYRLSELLGRKSYEFCTADAAEIIKQVTTTERRAGMISTYEITMISKTGEKIPLSVNGIPLDDGGTVGILRDLRRLKAAEEEAYKSQHYFEELFMQASDAIAACDGNEYVYDVNPAFTELFGYTPEEARGKHINDLIVPPNLIPGALDIARQVAQGKRSYLETIRQHKSGRLIHVTVTGASVTRSPVMKDGKRVGVFAIYRDITAHKEAEAALAESEVRYALVLQGANDGLWDWNIVTNEKYYSTRFKELIGFKDQEITNAELQKLFPTWVNPQDYDRMQRMTEAHLKYGTPYDIEYRMTLPNGEMRWFRSRAQAVWNEAGNPTRMAGSIRDVTRRKVAEAELASSKKLLHDILQGTPVATYVIDMNHKIIIWNKAMEQLAGRSASEMLGTDRHWEVFYPEKRPMIVDYMVDGRAAVDIIQNHYQHTNFQEGQLENAAVGDVFFPQFYEGGKWLRFIIKPLYDLEGKMIGAIETVEDIHDRKLAEERLQHFNEELQAKVAEKTKHLEEANKRLLTLHELKDEFIAVTSHELRSPLTAIRGYLSFLVDPEVLKTLPESFQKYLLRAHSNTETLSNLVNNILDVSRLEGGRFELKKTSVDLPALLRRILDNATLAAQDKKLKIRFFNKSDPSSLFIQADLIRLHQALSNLLDNAIKYSNRGKTIKVELRRILDCAELRFIDQGIGIPQKQIPHIFEKFMRVQNAASRYRGGAGLGLYITKKIVEHHGGTIQIESQRGQGTTFIIQLPLL